MSTGADATRSDSPPWQIGPFEIERRLGHQPGVVSLYAAHERRHGERVTLRLLGYLSSAPQAWRAQGRAMNLWRKLSHPGLVPLSDTGRSREGVWVATRRMTDVTLAEHLRRHGPLTPARTIAILAPVAAALDLVHGRELVCDTLTADTVLIRGPLGDERGLLADIGPAWTAAQRPGRLLGDVDGLAPEEIEGAAPARASNVYALGALLVRCLTAAPPFPAPGRAATLAAHLHAPPPRVCERGGALPAALDGLVAATLAKQPSERPATAGELIGGAARILGVEGAALAPRPDEPPAAAAASPRVRHGRRADPPLDAPERVAATVATPAARAPRSRARRTVIAIALLAPAAVLVALAVYLSSHPLTGSRGSPTRATTLPAPGGEARTVASAPLRPPDTATAATPPTGAVRIDAIGKRLLITIAGDHLPREGRDPVEAYTVWLMNSRDDALRLGSINPPVGSKGGFLSHGTLPGGSRRYHRIVVTLESELRRRPAGPVVLGAPLWIP
jgi:serine/threonine-protein kinase